MAFTLDNDIQVNFDKVNNLIKQQDQMNQKAKIKSTNILSEFLYNYLRWYIIRVFHGAYNHVDLSVLLH